MKRGVCAGSRIDSSPLLQLRHAAGKETAQLWRRVHRAYILRRRLLITVASRPVSRDGRCQGKGRDGRSSSDSWAGRGRRLGDNRGRTIVGDGLLKRFALANVGEQSVLERESATHSCALISVTGIRTRPPELGGGRLARPPGAPPGGGGGGGGMPAPGNGGGGGGGGGMADSVHEQQS